MLAGSTLDRRFDLYPVCAARLPQGPFAPTEQSLGLYPVVDSVQWLERLLEAGAKTLQLRIKDLSADEVMHQPLPRRWPWVAASGRGSLSTIIGSRP